MAVNPYDAAKNLGLGKGYSVGIMAKRPTVGGTPSSPFGDFNPSTGRYANGLIPRGGKPDNQGTPTVMEAPDATAPKPALGQGNLGLGSSPALQIGGTNKYGKPYGSMDMVYEQRKYIEELANLSDAEYGRWLESNRSNRPGGMDQLVGQIRARRKAGIPAGARSIKSQSGISTWRMPNGTEWETNGKGGWRQKGRLSQYKDWGAPPTGNEPVPEEPSGPRFLDQRPG